MEVDFTVVYVDTLYVNMYNGKPIEDYTKEELIQIVYDLINKLKYVEQEKARENRFFKKIQEHKKRRY